MKKRLLLPAVLLLCLLSATAARAECEWNTDKGIAAEWDAYSVRTVIELYKGSPDYEINRLSRTSCAAEKKKKDMTQLILDSGPGTYTYVIRTADGSVLEYSEPFQVSDDYYTELVLGNVTPTWQYSKGFWYLIDPLGRKLKGWHEVGEKWYYMSEDTGVCYIGRMTPDGYRVDENGAWDGEPSVYQ